MCLQLHLENMFLRKMKVYYLKIHFLGYCHTQCMNEQWIIKSFKITT